MTTLRSISSNGFIKKMAKLDLIEIPKELRQEMKPGSRAKGYQQRPLADSQYE